MCWKLQILKTPVNQEFQGTFRNGVKYLYGKSIERYDTISTLTRNDAYLVGNIKADKEKSAEKIDGAIATIQKRLMARLPLLLDLISLICVAFLRESFRH